MNNVKIFYLRTLPINSHLYTYLEGRVYNYNYFRYINSSQNYIILKKSEICHLARNDLRQLSKSGLNPTKSVVGNPALSRLKIGFPGKPNFQRAFTNV